MMKQNRLGFTLVELMVVLAIMGMLTALSVASFSAAGKSGRDGKRKADIEALRQALVLKRSDAGRYLAGGPLDMGPAGAVSIWLSGYISSPFPQDPQSTRAYTYSGTPTTGANFCVCAYLETSGTGNSTTAAGNATCSFGTGGDYYCATNP
jgi:prepilin-type N-terminal cleavage/methylation domain-containing protein